MQNCSRSVRRTMSSGSTRAAPASASDDWPRPAIRSSDGKAAQKIVPPRPEAILKRLQTKPPSGACYRCYYENGVIASIRGVPFDPATPKIDRFRCANGHYF